MTGFFMFLHAVVSILLLVIILMQSGRGGGLTESFASAETMFGAKTNEFMIKATTIFASLFLITCLGLAVYSSQKGKSLMSSKVASETQALPTTQEADTAVEKMDTIIVGDEKTAQAIPAEEETDVVTVEKDSIFVGDEVKVEAVQTETMPTGEPLPDAEPISDFPKN